MNEAEYQRPPIKVALMGLGRSMFADHYPVFRRHPALFRVVAACDLLKDRRDLVAKDYPECRMFRQFADMLDERDIDLVDIATCTNDHVQHAMMSLKKGFWTLVETPMALTPDEAQILRGQAQKSRNRLLVLQRGLFSPAFLLARQAIGVAAYEERNSSSSVRRLGCSISLSRASISSTSASTSSSCSMAASRFFRSMTPSCDISAFRFSAI